MRSYEANFTPFQLKRMTNDPKTNPELGAFPEKLDNPAAEAIAIAKLAALLAGDCRGAKANENLLRRYVATKFSGLSSGQFEDANFQANRRFQGFDFVELTQLCAGIDWLFGPHGSLLPNAVSPGSGEVDLGAAPAQFNPYVRMQE